MSETTTVRVSRRTQHVLSDLAAAEGSSVSELLERLAEQARRQRILDESSARIAVVMADPSMRAAYEAELRLDEEAAPSGTHP